MPKENYPSSFECDCGHVSDFVERTVREIREMSRKKRVSLGDSAKEEHWVVFEKGEMVDIICPKRSLPAPEAGSPAAPQQARDTAKRRR